MLGLGLLEIVIVRGHCYGLIGGDGAVVDGVGEIVGKAGAIEGS